jgi:tRNA A-37 threonylcarbamoyl transferase component Bud32
MVNLPDGAQESEILEWIKGSIKNRSNIYSRGYQGQTYVFKGKRQRLIIKSPSGWGVAKLIRRWMLRNEYRVYTKLSGLKGIPVCYGLIDGRYLVLEFIGGTPIRSARIADPGRFFKSLLNLIKEVHHLGVAHTDLKKKDNILVVDGKTPYVVDFGVAVVRKPGFAPLNHYLYKLAKKFDYNAWAKLKYNRKLKYISVQDRQYYDRTFVEKASRRIKRMYRSVKSRFEAHP